MTVLVCGECNTEVEVEYLSDITECPNCGAEVRKETCPLVEE